MKVSREVSRCAHVFSAHLLTYCHAQKPMLGMWYGAFPSTGIARVLGQAGYDYIFMDWEHTPYSESCCLVCCGHFMSSIRHRGSMRAHQNDSIRQ